MPILKNANFSDTSRSLIWHFPNKWTDKDGPGINYYSAIRKGDWKMIYSMRTGKKELYNLAIDIGESNDLSSQYAGKLVELSTLLSNQFRQWKSPMPRFKNTGKLVPFPDGL